MSSPLFNALGGSQMPEPINQFGKMIQDFQRFRAGFQGNPKEEVQKLLQSGQMSQQQFNQLQAMAQQFQQLLR